MKNCFLFLLILPALFLVGNREIQFSAQSATATSKEGKAEIPNADSDAIQQTALDYIEGWYEGNTMRMNRSLHPDLIKRKIEAEQIQAMSKRDLVAYTNHARFPGQKWDVKILDIYKNIAKVKVDSTDYMDYLQLGKIQGKWVIVNVLWAKKR
jgi:hypothetical protein